MKKFNDTFDSYELSLERPMTIELHRQGVARYKPLFDNPIYYYHALQYTNGDFYRAVLGYEAIWDLDFETTLVRALDSYLHQAEQHDKYFLEEIEIQRSCTFIGKKWKRGVKPVYRIHASKDRHSLKRSQRGLARVNRIETPYLVDIEIYDTGEIFTLRHTQYYTLKGDNKIRSLRDEKRKRSKESKQDGADAQNAKRGTLKSFTRFGSYVSSGKADTQMSRVRKRFRRSY